ncbi:MAG: VWA-like domain-containing protein [Floccifex porci]|uniref:vWA domain-containing protein n=1 Tax=Floccifex porci TaxID=2606629 RepID=UPI002A832B58|nr:VWA-like domain-containing protein [Floccifex porci]MDY4796198.1 VWA-like domain-containing protein [Floccifex porci]
MKYISEIEWQQQVCVQIMEHVKSELFLDFPFMALPLNGLQMQMSDSLKSAGCDGKTFYFSNEFVIRIFKKNPVYLNRIYLHSILHCVFSHLWISSSRNMNLWHIACDICVEYTLDHLEKKSVKRILSYIRKKTYQILEKEYNLSASGIYLYLLNLDSKQLLELKNEFICDDHRYWPKSKEESQSIGNQNLKNSWKQKAIQSSLQNKNQMDGKEEGSYSWQIKMAESKRSYREFLKKFMVLKEEVKINEDEYDLSYYTYGLRLYKNLPLIEPIETKEERKIPELVIVLDTSYSTSGNLIKNFLKETSAILKSNVFFSNSKIHIIQCDNRVQDHKILTSFDQMDEFLESFTVIGGNGTDFRPVFDYVNECMEQGICKEVSALLYFTDGKGIYPKRRPNYKCAFLFLEDYDRNLVPTWAISQRMDLIEILGG